MDFHLKKTACVSSIFGSGFCYDRSTTRKNTRAVKSERTYCNILLLKVAEVGFFTASDGKRIPSRTV